jgi:hypothetical protein
MFVNDTNPGPLNPPSLGDFERVGSPRIGGWGAVRHLYHSLEYLVLASNPGFTTADPSISEIDAQLHLERITSNKVKVTFTRKLDSLPQGTLIEYKDKPHLIFGRC